MTSHTTTTPSATPSITIKDGHPVTTSLDVAEKFGKRHRDVLRSVKMLDVPPDWHARNFALMSREVQIGNGATRQEPMVEMTRDGFTLVAMGFTGREALAWKLKYIDAFNRMEAQLAQPAPPPTLSSTLEPLLTGMMGVMETLARRLEEQEPSPFRIVVDDPGSDSARLILNANHLPDLNFPWETAKPIGGSGCFLTYTNSICHPKWQSPTWKLLARLEELGFDVQGPKIEQMAMRWIMGRMMSYSHMQGYDLREGVAYNPRLNATSPAKEGPPKGLAVGLEMINPTIGYAR